MRYSDEVGGIRVTLPAGPVEIKDFARASQSFGKRLESSVVDGGRRSRTQDTRAAVSGEVRALMGRYSVTQTVLAPALGMSQSALSERLTGTVPWTVDDLARVADYFDVDVAEIFTSAIAHNPRYCQVDRASGTRPHEPILVGTT